jgi:uncharacterized protein
MQSDGQMKTFVLNLLDSKLSSDYHYHDSKHTLYVIDKTIEIAKHENCTADEIRLLTVAAIWHDVGHIKIYNGHEKESCNFARQYLPGYGFSDDEINQVCGMIMATQIPQSPQNRLEEILADADLEYLGTANTGKMSENLFLELHSMDTELTREEWNAMQITFLKDHHYFTNFCKKNREPVKAAYLKKLLEQQ